MSRFGARLAEAIEQRGPLCVGIDAHSALLRAWGLTDDVAGLAEFCRIVVDALADRAAVVKPQSAFFERFGAAGITVLESTIRQARAAGALVLLDVKRGDIGSTAEAYAQAYLASDSALFVDAITVSPYLGFGALAPIVDQARRVDGGIFAVALSSNPEGASVQLARRPDGRSVAQFIVDEAAQVNATLGAAPGFVGVVVGATGEERLDLASLNGPVLVPGLGAQGGTPQSLRAAVSSASGPVLPSSSREILAAGPDLAGLRAAFEQSLAACHNVLN